MVTRNKIELWWRRDSVETLLVNGWMDLLQQQEQLVHWLSTLLGTMFNRSLTQISWSAQHTTQQSVVVAKTNCWRFKAGVRKGVQVHLVTPWPWLSRCTSHCLLLDHVDFQNITTISRRSSSEKRKYAVGGSCVEENDFKWFKSQTGSTGWRP